MNFLRRFLAPERPQHPRAVPKGLRVFAVGDVHGCLSELLTLEEMIRARAGRPGASRNLIVYLGDYVDRGPDSAGVLAHLANPPDDGLTRRMLMGNHEEMLLKLREEPDRFQAWRQIGGVETLASYGIDVAPLMTSDGVAAAAMLARALPPSHLRLLQGLEQLLVVGGYAFVHAGIRPGLPLEQQSAQDLLWIRDAFLEAPGPHSHFIIHGHTPVEAPDRRPHRLNLDTGVYLTGRLSAVQLEGDRLEVFGT